MNSKSKFKSNIGDLKTVKKDGHCNVIDNDMDKANALGDFFSSIYTREPDDAFEELPTQNPPNPFEEVTFTDDDILERLSKINIYKSPGPDSLHPRILYEVRHVIATPLRIIFEASYQLGVIPSDWKIAETVPIYKKGSRAELNNYRPVSMTSVTCKLMESIIRDHVLNYFMRNK